MTPETAQGVLGGHAITTDSGPIEVPGFETMVLHGPWRGY